MTQMTETRNSLQTDPYTDAVVTDMIPKAIQNEATTVFSDLGHELHQLLTDTYRNEQALLSDGATRDGGPAYDLLLRERIEGLNYVLDSLGQERVGAVAESYAQRQFQMPAEVPNFTFPEKSKPDIFESAVTRQLGEHVVPSAAVTVIADLGRRYKASLVGGVPPNRDPRVVATGLRFVLESLGQVSVATLAENGAKKLSRITAKK